MRECLSFCLKVAQEFYNTLFLRKKGKCLLIVKVYVYDVIFGATDEYLCKEFLGLMGKKYEMSMMDELDFFLVLKVKQTPK